MELPLEREGRGMRSDTPPPTRQKGAPPLRRRAELQGSDRRESEPGEQAGVTLNSGVLSQEWLTPARLGAEARAAASHRVSVNTALMAAH